MSDNIFKNVCSFCGMPTSEDTLLVQGNIQENGEAAKICINCVEEVKAIADMYAKKIKKASFVKSNIKPSSIRKYLDEYVIKQNHAKTVLSVAIYNHYKFLEYKKQESPAVDLEKSNILLVGPTGSGKTYLIKTIAKMLDVPFAIGDASSLTAAGYVGNDVENVIRNLVENANGDIDKAERGIVYIDEIDKLSRKGENPSITRDVGGEGVQQALLKMIEGDIIEVPPKGQRKHPSQDVVKVDTSNILFIVGGSFEGVDKQIQKRQTKDLSSMGFGSAIKSTEEKTFNESILDIKAEDLRKFGMLPEFIGRFPIICPLQELDEEALLSILTEPKNALSKQYKELLKIDGVELEFEKDALTEIAKKAIERKTGARSLRSIMEETLLSHMFSLPDRNDVLKMIITKECVSDNAEPVIELKDEIKVG